MIKTITNSISKFFFIFFLRINFKKNFHTNFNDLNFKQNDFTNYKLIRHYIFKEKFIYNISISDIHTFNFLFYFQKIGGKKGVDLSKKNIFSWFNQYKFYKNFPWSNDYSSKRFINLIYNYDFICSNSSSKEIILLNYILNFHINRITFDNQKKLKENTSSYDLLSNVLINCIKKTNATKTLNEIKNIINAQVDENSVHKSYNILEHSKFLNNLNEIKNILLFFEIKIPRNLNNTILSMTSLLGTYMHNDLSLPLFNGCNNNHNTQIKKIIEKEQFLKNVIFKEFKNGIAVYKDISKTLFFDVVQHTGLGICKELSAGTLSVEISADNEKIITNCGGAEISGKNPSYLKYSAAHSTIIINNTNISQIGGIKENTNFPNQVKYEEKDNEDEALLSGTHNGYTRNYKKICKRELRLNKKKNLFQGEDTIISTKSSVDKIIYHIRFHLMPGISTTITKNKKNIIIKTKKNNIWMFKSDSEIMIEKSIYVNNDLAIETSQIVITGLTSSLKNKIQWSLEKI